MELWRSSKQHHPEPFRTSYFIDLRNSATAKISGSFFSSVSYTHHNTHRRPVLTLGFNPLPYHTMAPQGVQLHTGAKQSHPHLVFYHGQGGAQEHFVLTKLSPNHLRICNHCQYCGKTCEGTRVPPHEWISKSLTF